MQKQAPSIGRLLVMVGFALSCFGILVYLWLTFGGSTPLKPKGYRVDVLFPEATTLAQEADVRISGVPVGKVKKKELDGRRTRVELEIDSKYAPIPRDTRAILRQKTLLGETYVELTPGRRSSGRVPDGGTLAAGNVAPTVELDEIFRTFDDRTRAALRTWLDQQGRAYAGRGQDLNDALGNLAPFAEDTRQVLEILNEQNADVRRLVRNTGVVFDAITERRGQLRELIRNSNRVFETTAARDRELADTFRALPTFMDESRLTLQRVSRFADQANPLISQLRPAARQLSPTLLRLRDLAPDLRALFRDLDPLISVSRRGLPATEDFLDETRPLLAQVDPFLRNLNPMLDWLGMYKREIAAFFALDSAATQASDQPPGSPNRIHYLRTTNPVNPEVLAAYPRRLATSRSNPYVAPGGYERLRDGLEVFGTYLCGSQPVAQLAPGVSSLLPQQLRDLIQEFVFTATGPVAPPCRQQQPLGRLLGQSGLYPHIEGEPER
jgi:phospholipid/cholesterol/gamma-HCH transport system substrate-binding protein